MMTLRQARFGLLTYLFILLVLSWAALTMPGCSGMPIEQQAQALYGTFVTTEKAAQQAIQSPEISDAVKLKIQAADRDAKPAADALEAALLAYRKDKGNPDLLEKALSIAAPAIAAFGGVTP